MSSMRSFCFSVLIKTRQAVLAGTGGTGTEIRNLEDWPEQRVRLYNVVIECC